MREVKVGQVWKWHSDDVEGFEVTRVDGFSVTYEYLESKYIRTRTLDWWNDDAVLVKDVEEPVEEEDAVNHPSHYNSDPSGVECIEITRHRNFNIGAAIKYLWRAGLKEDSSLDNLEKEIQDLEKAIFHIKDEIKRKRGA